MGFHAPASFGTATRVARGARNNLAGRMAEDAVADRYARLGARIVARRWRSASGEIDLIARRGDEMIFIEVKCARTHDEAICRLGPRQVRRICAAATDYCATLATGLQTAMRFDVALVDALGRISIVENAIGDW